MTCFYLGVAWEDSERVLVVVPAGKAVEKEELAEWLGQKSR